MQGAVLQVIEPIYERDFAGQSYGFRPGKGCKDALRRVDELLKSGYHWVVDADLKSYFDTIPHEGLMARIGEKIADSRVLNLIKGMLQAGVMDSLKGWQPTEQGSPQGAVISPLLSNIYLNGLDWKMEEAGFEMVRYADDHRALQDRIGSPRVTDSNSRANGAMSVGTSSPKDQDRLLQG